MATKKEDIELNKLEKQIEDLEKGSVIICRKCRQFKRYSNYYEATDPIIDSNGRMSICKDCINEYFSEILDNNAGNYKYAMLKTCELTNTLFDEEVYDMFDKHITTMQNNNKASNSMFGIYKSKLSTFSKKKNIDDLRYKFDIGSIESVVEEVVDSDVIEKWGVGYTPSQYKELERIMSGFKDYEQTTYTQVILIENICKNLLRANEALGTDSKEYDNAMNMVSKLMGDGNLKPSQETGANSPEHSSFGMWIKKIENEEPILETREEFQDIDKIKELIRTYFVGHISHIFNGRNKYKKEYEEEMNRYKVDVSFDEEEDGETDGWV